MSHFVCFVLAPLSVPGCGAKMQEITEILHGFIPELQCLDFFKAPIHQPQNKVPSFRLPSSSASVVMNGVDLGAIGFSLRLASLTIIFMDWGGHA